MNKLTEIVKSWAISFNPTPGQKSLAEYRASVCDTCSFKKDHPILKYPICGDCKCPLSAKIFSPIPKSCPKNLWMA